MEKIITGAIDDLEPIASWITESGELELISGEKGKVLKSELLAEWLTTSITNVISYDNAENVIGLTTLSTAEMDLPVGYVELCHCIIKPNNRREYNASCLLVALIREAKKRGYTHVVGRVVKSNNKAHHLLKSLKWKRWERMNEKVDSENIIWYIKKIVGKNGKIRSYDLEISEAIS